MTLTAFLVGLVVFAAIGLLAVVWRPADRLGRAAHAAAVTPNPAKVYWPILRLFAQRDLDFLRQQSGYRANMGRRFRLQRRHVLALFLRDMHQDFRLLKRSCRLLARQTHNWELGYLAERQGIVFLSLLLALRTRCLLNWFIYVQIDAADLVSSLQRLQQELRAVRASMQPPVGVAPLSKRG